MSKINITLDRNEAVITQIALAIYSEQTTDQKPIYQILKKFDTQLKLNQ